MASNQEQYAEQLELLQKRFPQESTEKLLRFLERHNGDVDQVRAYFVQREFREKKMDLLETRFGPALAALQQEQLSSQQLKRARLLKIMERFGGDVDNVRKYLEKNKAKQNGDNTNSYNSEFQQRENQKTKYATQLVELQAAGININTPSVLIQLEKHHGDVNKVMEIMKNRLDKKVDVNQLNTIYANQVAQLEADGIKIKNKRLLLQLLDKANGQVDVVKQLLDERKEQKHQIDTASSTAKECDDTVSFSKKSHEITTDDIDNLKQLRAAGAHGNPMKILALFHECNQSIELTIARMNKEREQREQQSEKRTQQRLLLAEIHGAYLTLDNQNDWPNDIQQVYLDGNNMMFVVDSLRQLCLNGAGKKTERAIAQIAAAWNQQMHIPNIQLIFDSTNQLDQIDTTIQILSAQPNYKTTDDMLIDITQRIENKIKNRKTIVVTSDRALAIQLKRKECQVVTSYMWFAHCVMVLAPDLIKQEESTNMTSIGKKTRYNFDELVRRIVKIDL